MFRRLGSLFKTKENAKEEPKRKAKKKKSIYYFWKILFSPPRKNPKDSSIFTRNGKKEQQSKPNQTDRLGDKWNINMSVDAGDLKLNYASGGWDRTCQSPSWSKSGRYPDSQIIQTRTASFPVHGVKRAFQILKNRLARPRTFSFFFFLSLSSGCRVAWIYRSWMSGTRNNATDTTAPMTPPCSSNRE